MPTLDSLPLILVTAADVEAASTFIKDLVEEDVSCEYSGEGEGGSCVVWRIHNKYYSADVRLLVQTDGLTLQEREVHAHVICLKQHECSEQVADMRRFPGRHGVRLVLAQCQEATDSLLTWGHKYSYEVVPLLECAENGEEVEYEESGAFRELYGVHRARAALHANVWPAPGRAYDSDSGSSSCGGSESECSEGSAVERAEQLGAALSALAGLRGLPVGERAEHAEPLLAAFARALGHRLDSL